jgi:CO dehydrogenase/acetyl-CoA synthase beta subunit
MYRRPKFDIGQLRHKEEEEEEEEEAEAEEDEEEEEDFSRWGTSGANMAVVAQQSISLGTGIRRLEKRSEMVPRIKLSIQRVERNK